MWRGRGASATIFIWCDAVVGVRYGEIGSGGGGVRISFFIANRVVAVTDREVGR